LKSKFYIWICRFFAPIVRVLFRIHSHGSENEPTQEQGPYVLICNHISNADPVFLCASLKNQQPHYMAKKELFKVPLVNKLVAALGAFPVDRSGADVSAIKNSIKMLESGRCIGIFPQGHREKGKTPMEATIKNGAAMLVAKTGVTVLPCCIRTKKNKFAFFRRIDVYVGKPIPFEEFAYDPKATGEYKRMTSYMFSKVCELYQNADGQVNNGGK